MRTNPSVPFLVWESPRSVACKMYSLRTTECSGFLDKPFTCGYTRHLLVCAFRDPQSVHFATRRMQLSGQTPPSPATKDESRAAVFPIRSARRILWKCRCGQRRGPLRDVRLVHRTPAYLRQRNIIPVLDSFLVAGLHPRCPSVTVKRLPFVPRKGSYGTFRDGA